jgi:transposase
LAQTALAPDQKGALKTGAPRVFWDEAGFSQRPSVRRTWAPRGKTPVLKQPFNWKRLSAIGMIAYRPASDAVRVLFSLGPGNVDSDWVLRGLRSLRRHLSGAVILLWDGLPAHRSAHTQRHLEAQHHWLQVERLPAYAPELNPVEAMWANLSARELANLCPETLAELATHVQRGVRRIRPHPTLGCAFLRHSGLFPQSLL